VIGWSTMSRRCARISGGTGSICWDTRTAIAPFTYGRWDAVSQAHRAQEASQKNTDAAAVYYSAGGLDPEATRSALAHLRAPILLVAGEYDVALPPKCAAEYAGLRPISRFFGDYARDNVTVLPCAPRRHMEDL
jgi:pimeloyl-ACP methyl ester carboxylesterase